MTESKLTALDTAKRNLGLSYENEKKYNAWQDLGNKIAQKLKEASTRKNLTPAEKKRLTEYVYELERIMDSRAETNRTLEQLFSLETAVTSFAESISTSDPAQE